MPFMSTVIVMGSLTRDPDLKFLKSGTAVSSLGIAVYFRNNQEDSCKKEVSFFEIVAYGNLAQACAEHLSKGQSALVLGTLHQRRWESHGIRRSKIEIVAEKIQFLGHADIFQGEKFLV